MTQKEFTQCLNTIFIGNRAIKGERDIRTKTVYVLHARLAYKRCKKELNDVDGNLKRWLLGKPCVFCHPFVGRVIEIEIGKDYEAIYRFLEYCRRTYAGERVDDDFITYLAYLIARSKSSEPVEY